MKQISPRRLLVLIVIILIICVLIKSLKGKKIIGKEIAIIYDKAGNNLDDGFFLDCYNGVYEYAENNNKTYQTYELKGGFEATFDEKLDAVDEAIANGAKILIMPGYSQQEVIVQKAKEYQDIKFVFLDGNTLGYNNVTAVSFKEEESGFMAGYAAVYDGYTNIGGTFGGGGTNPAVNRFLYGFAQGVAKAAKEKKTKIKFLYSFKNGQNYEASKELQEQISDWYDERNVQVVFACGGSIFYSVKMAAEATKSAKIIGVDVDQSTLSSRVITSAKKGLKEAITKILTQYYQGLWDLNLANKTQNLGILDDATGIYYDTSKFKFYSKSLYKKNIQDIKDGFVKIKSELPTDCNNLTWIRETFKDNEYVDFQID